MDMEMKKWSVVAGIVMLVSLSALGTVFADTPNQRVYSGPIPAQETKAQTEEYNRKLWVSQKPFQPYLTEEQLFDEPSGTVEISGIKADSFAKGQEVSWRTGNWEFYAAGHFEQDGIRVAGEVLKALEGRTDLIPGAVRGKLRAAEFGNPMFVTISWTYDGKIWYELYDEKGSPERMVKMLEAAAQNSDPAVLLNGEPLQNTAEVRNGSLFLPLRAVCEALGFEVRWSQRKNTVTVAGNGKNIILNLTVPSINVDSRQVSLKGKYIAIDGSTYMEKGFFSDYLGIQVKWDKAARTVTLN